mgnify:CR=1 FL=1
MKIYSQNSAYREIKKFPQKDGASDRRIYSPKISFGSDPIKAVSKLSGNITEYKNIDAVVRNVDKILGEEGYLASKINKAGLKT